MIEYIASTGSTNADLIDRVAVWERVPEGYWWVADRQEAGRGRRGRTWFDGAGNFMGSTIVWRHRGDPPAGSLALLAGIALHEVLSGFLPAPHRAELKWPNDVLVAGAKLAGILLEAAGDAIIVGIGVNLAQAPDLPDRETVALSAFGPAPDRNLFAEALSRQFDIELARWREFGLEPLLRRWQAAAHPPGTRLAVGESGEEPLIGAFAGLGVDGALQLRLADGTTRTIHAGEIRLV